MKKIQQLLDLTFWKFVLVGIINTVVGTTVMFVAYNALHFSYWVSSASNYIIGSIVSYFLNKYFTFQNKEKSAKQIAMFITNITICYLLAYGLAKPVVSWILNVRARPYRITYHASMNGSIRSAQLSGTEIICV